MAKLAIYCLLNENYIPRYPVGELRKNYKNNYYTIEVTALEKSAIILGGGHSKRFGLDKGLLMLGDKPIINHILDRVSVIVDEIIVVVGSDSQRDHYAYLEPIAQIVVDKLKTKSPLVGALTGFEFASGDYSLLLPCDTPFFSSRIGLLLIDMCVTNAHIDAVVPQWPNGYIEPLQAVYHTESAIAAAKKALEEQKLNMHSLINHLRKPHYVPISTFKHLDPELMTFFNVNTPLDLETARKKLLVRFSDHFKKDISSQNRPKAHELASC